MHISDLSIRNFRNFRRARFSFAKGVNTLIGENGSGKSNALYALRLLIDDALSRRSMLLDSEDFARILGDWRGHWIIIAATFQELDLSEGCQFIRHGVGNPDVPGTGRLALLFRPNRAARRRLFEAGRDGGPEGAKAAIRTLEIENYESCFTGRAEADFLDDGVYGSIVGRPEAGICPDPANEDLRAIGVPTPGLHYDVTCTFIKALRDVVADLKSARTNPLLTLLRGAEKTIRLQDAESITETVRKLNADIADLGEIKEVSNGIRKTMLASIGRTYATDVDIASELPDDLEHLMQHLALRVGDEPGFRGDVTDVGLGGANLVFIALKLLEYELKTASDRVAHFLLIEEPEAHIHPHVQRTLFKRHQSARTQVIVTSHSTHLSSAASIESMSILARRQGEAVVFSPSAGLTKEDCSRAERYLDAVRSTLLFAKGVLLVEGDAESVLIPAMVSRMFGVSLDELGVSLVSVGGAIFRQLAPLFHPDRIQRPCAIVTDLDAPLVALPVNEADDTADQRGQRRAAAIGQSRQRLLKVAAKDNPWVEAFFATTTFEIEFLLAGNRRVVVEALGEVFDREATRQKSKSLLEGDDKAAAGAEILRIAEYFGKGWFALLLAGKLEPTVTMPSYILSALAFASRETVTPSILMSMAKYRIDAGIVDGQACALPDGSPEQDRIDAYAKAFKDDALSVLMAGQGIVA